MDMNEVRKAYTILETKDVSSDAEFTYIKGIASTPKADAMNDVVEPLGAIFSMPMPLLLRHAHSEPVGEVTFAKPTAQGIPFEARLPHVKEEGVVKTRVEEAIHSLRYNLIKAVSIGFRPVEGEVEILENNGYRFKKWRWMELSLVTIPANDDAVITAIKSFNGVASLPATGKNGKGITVDKTDPGDSGKTKTAFRGSVKLIKRNQS